MRYARWIKIYLKDSVIENGKELKELSYIVGESPEGEIGKISQIKLHNRKITISFEPSPDFNEVKVITIFLSSNVLKYHYGREIK